MVSITSESGATSPTSDAHNVVVVVVAAALAVAVVVVVVIVIVVVVVVVVAVAVVVVVAEGKLDELWDGKTTYPHDFLHDLWHGDQQAPQVSMICGTGKPKLTTISFMICGTGTNKHHKSP